MNYKYKLSVIVPCYNVENYLDLSLQCLAEQWDNDKNIQFILVNDGSTDKTLSKLKQFKQEHDKNTVLINKPNGGLSSARNAGLKVVEGRHVTFFDPDDALVYGSYQYLYEHFIENSVYNTLSFKTNQIHAKGFVKNMCLETSFLNAEPQVEYEGNGHDFFLKFNTYVTWIFFYSTKLLKDNNLSFDENLSFLEDTLFNLHYFFLPGVYVRRVDCCVHFWINRKESLSSFIGTSSKLTKMIGCCMVYLEHLEKFKKLHSEDQALCKRIEYFQKQKSAVSAMLLHSDMGINQIITVRKRLHEMKLFPFQYKGIKSFIYNVMFYIPALFLLARLFFKQK